MSAKNKWSLGEATGTIFVHGDPTGLELRVHNDHGLAEFFADANAAEELRAALLTVLDQVDYTTGACRLTNMVGACLDKKVIENARATLASHKAAQGGKR